MSSSTNPGGHLQHYHPRQLATESQDLSPSFGHVVALRAQAWPHASRCRTSVSQKTGFRNQDFGSHLVTDGPKDLSMYVSRGPLALRLSLEVTAVTPTPSLSPSLPARGEKKVHGFPRAPWVAEALIPTCPHQGCTVNQWHWKAVTGTALATDSSGSSWTSLRVRIGSPAPAALTYSGDQVPASCHTLQPRSLEQELHFLLDSPLCSI